MDEPKKDREVLIPEVLPPEPGEPGRRESSARRAERAFGPIVAGAIIDAIDFALVGPAGLVIGFLAGFWIGSIYGFSFMKRVAIGILAGWYCMIPFTRFIPLATLVGAYAQFRGR